tara:strand:+ start:9062 stop:10606 length:1545 start_codon:yes stop_codon:yes gene_type:complete
MSWINFCRINQAIEELTPTASISRIKNSWDTFDDKETLMSLFAMEYPMNNLGQKKAIKWISEALQVFEDEIETHIDIYGDIGEGLYFFDGDNEDSDLTLKQVHSILSLNCSRMESNAFTLFSEVINKMSPIEKKWFVRFLIRKPRNGFASQSNGNLVKLLSSVYGKKLAIVKRHYMFNSLSNITSCYENQEEPETNLEVGIYLSPMLAKALERSKWPKPLNRVLEYKYDGARYQIHRNNDTVIIFNRKGVIVTDQFADIVELVKSWDISTFIVDSEIFPISNDGSPATFQTMNVRFHGKDKEAARQKCPVALAVFDVLMVEGVSLIDEPLSVRMASIERFPNQAVREKNGKRVKAFYAEAIEKGFEGIMVKSLDATYDSGKRSKDWVKYKPPRIELDVVITGVRFGDGKRSNVYGSYDIAVSNDEGGFTTIGAIGSGFTDVDLSILTQRLRPLVLGFENNSYSVSPRIVLQVTSDLVTKNENGTFGLRFPRMMRIRDDKPVSEINTINDVAEML